MRLVSFCSLAAVLAGCQFTRPDAADAGPILLVPDVGLGHGVALVQGDRAVVVDVGPPGQKALDEALKAQGVREIQLLVLTHPDQDHFGGLDSLSIPVRELLRGAMSEADSARAIPRCTDYEQGCVRALPSQEFHVLDDVVLRVLGPSDTSLAEEANANSLVVELSRGGRSLFLASGDLDTLGELLILSRVRTTEVVQMGHHGSKGSSHLRWLGAMMPAFALVQAGVDNDYGHPSAQALARASAVGAEVVRPLGQCLKIKFDPSARLLPQ
jgi:competence protein ComEC